MNPETFSRLSAYLEARNDVVFAVLFGSAATGRETIESDVDVGVYLFDSADAPPRYLEIEEERRFPGENEIWGGIEAIVHREVDLVVLNRASAGVAASAVTEGQRLCVHDETLFSRFMIAVTNLAEDFRGFVDEFIEIRRRSQSLSERDRSRLVRLGQYLRDELGDAGIYGDVDRDRYLRDRHFRRAIERWIENLVNASIDIAKIVVASEGLSVPQSYRETLMSLGTIDPFRAIAVELATNTRTRNVLAHEYLDLRYDEVSRIARRANEVYGALSDSVDVYVKHA